MISVQPSSEMHWKTVSMASPKLSKLVMPLLGPFQLSSFEQLLTPGTHLYSPPQGVGSSTISPAIQDINFRKHTNIKFVTHD